jgi:hypothetical protein
MNCMATLYITPWCPYYWVPFINPSRYTVKIIALPEQVSSAGQAIAAIAGKIE